MSDSGFLQRWARRKAQARRETSPLTRADALPAAPAAAVAAEQTAGPTRPASEGRADEPLAPGAPLQAAPPGAAGSVPSDGLRPADPLPAVETLTPADDFSAFMADGVDAATRNGALRKLFTDPRFNVMDGLDTYIDDYGKPDPIPPAMLRTLRQAHALGLFDEDPQGEGEAAAARPPATAGAKALARIEEIPDGPAPRHRPATIETTAAPGDDGFASAPGAHYDPTRRAGSP